MDEEMNELVLMTMAKVKAKLEAARDAGPFGPPVELEPDEAMLVWRLLFDRR